MGGTGDEDAGRCTYGNVKGCGYGNVGGTRDGIGNMTAVQGIDGASALCGANGGINFILG